MKNQNSEDWREWRRLQAIKLYRQYWQQQAIALALDVSEAAVSRWISAYRDEGKTGLLSHSRQGRPPKLTSDQIKLLVDFLWHGAESYGFQGDVWTCARITGVIQQEFCVRYSKSEVSRLLKKLNWTPQVPITRAIQRDEDVIMKWRKYTWPSLKRRAQKDKKVLVFIDESGFYLLPSIVKTYSPKGLTPILHEWKTYSHLSVMGGVTLSGKIYVLVRRQSLNGLNTIEFPKHLMRHLGHRLLIIWDGSSIHRRAAVTEFLESRLAKDIHVEKLPAYAPELSPLDQGTWNHLKNVELRNTVCLDLDELQLKFYAAVERLRKKPKLIKSFFKAAKLSLKKI